MDGEQLRTARWATAASEGSHAFAPSEGVPDLNDAALQLAGVLFVEGKGRPGEIRHRKRDLRRIADNAALARHRARVEEVAVTLSGEFGLQGEVRPQGTWQDEQPIGAP